MSEPIVFISHFRVKAGKAEAYKELQRDTAKLLLADKPRTLVYLAYLTESGDQITIDLWAAQRRSPRINGCDAWASRPGR